MMNRDSSSDTWQESLKAYFPQNIRTRGNSYVRKHRVSLRQARRKLISGKVHGSRSYSVELSLDENDENQIRVFCTCPHFRRGYACKHLWAAIVAADRKIGLEPAPVQRSRSQPSPSGSRPDPEVRAPKTPPDWREALLSGQQSGELKSLLEGGPGGFRLCYELHVIKGMALVKAYQQYIRKNGSHGRSRGLEYRLLQNPGMPHEDQIVLTTLRAAFHRDLASSHPVEVHIAGRQLNLVVPYLARTHRCTVYKDGTPVASPLGPGSPFDLQARLVPRGKRPEQAKTLSFMAVVPLPDEEGEATLTPLEDLPMTLGDPPAHCISGGRLYRIQGLDERQLAAIVASQNHLRVPREDLGDFVEALESGARAPQVELPDKLRPREEEILPVPRLRLEIEEQGLQGEVAFDYNGFAVSPSEERTRILDRESWRSVVRDPDAERQHLQELEECGFAYGNSCGCTLDKAPTAIQSLVERGWRVEGRDGKPVRSGSSPSVGVSSSGLDWFDLDGEIEFSDTSVALPRAVQEFLQGNRTVRLDDGSQGILPLEWLQKHAGDLALGLESRSKRSKGSENLSLRYHKSQALALDNLVQQDEDARLEDHFLRIRDELRRFGGLEPCEPPKDFQGTLRQYQKDGLSWFEFLARFGFGGVLADDMGLGKTIQVLARLLQRKEEAADAPSLVVAPASLVLNWREEASHFAPQLELITHVGPDRPTRAEDLQQADLVVTTYGVLRMDTDLLRDIRFDYVVLDESQAIKNSQSKTFQAAKTLQSRHRLCLTGTPLENNLAELWSQMDFLNSGLLRSSSRFEQTLAAPARRGDTRAGESLRRLIKPFILRRTKEQVAPELPDKTEHILTCPMRRQQSDLYKRILAHYRESVLQSVDTQGMNKSKIKVLEGLLRLRQIACHPGLVDSKGTDSGKMDKLHELVREVRAGGHKGLVFSQYTRLLRLIKQEFDELELPYFSLEGRTPQKRRKQRVDAFQESEDSCFFLISLKAGGTGLNLTAADYVFILDPWWNPAVEMQAVDRTHRIGQQKKVVSYRLISESSVEEKVLSLQEKKQELVSSVLSGSNDLLGNLTRSDLEHLFS